MIVLVKYKYLLTAFLVSSSLLCAGDGTDDEMAPARQRRGFNIRNNVDAIHPGANLMLQNIRNAHARRGSNVRNDDDNDDTDEAIQTRAMLQGLINAPTRQVFLVQGALSDEMPKRTF